MMNGLYEKTEGKAQKKTGRKGWIEAKRKTIFWMMLTAALLSGAGMAVSAAGLYLFSMPCRLEEDCTGAGVDAQTIKRWEEKEKIMDRGILAIAGWRMERGEEVISLGTGRRKQARIVAVCGSMELVFPERILSGNCGVVANKEGCVLSKGLADALFGSVDVEGEKICLQETGGEESDGGRKAFVVVGVIDKEGEYLMIYTEKGTMDRLAVSFKNRFQAREKLRELWKS